MAKAIGIFVATILYFGAAASATQAAPTCASPERVAAQGREAVIGVESISAEGVRSFGAGVIWDYSGHIITAAHVITNSNRISVVQANGRSESARIVGVDTGQGIAVLRAESVLGRPITPGQAETARPGQSVVGLGYPRTREGEPADVVIGVIGAVKRALPGPYGKLWTEMIQTDALPSFGAGGGPLLDCAGQMIGLSLAVLAPEGRSIGIGFALPIERVMASASHVLSPRLH
ncbi:exported hypothetical protein [Azospirillaceae bacterium]